MDKYNTNSLDFCNKNKIDKQNTSNLNNNYTIMKPTYSTDEKLLCGIVEYNNRKYFVDLIDKDRIVNFNKHFVFINETDIYPSYSCNYKRFNYLDFIFNYNQETVYYVLTFFHKLTLDRYFHDKI
jgi:hypothetical protein